ncbi:hypothetical protein AB0C69_12240 [Actinomadura sp. NPDC048032]|uniref:RICIN domain-containing protein n=1 Tax=Actinomadura sp. NPDC048032 TaxID=3155747 RepID=UPI0033E23874
MNDDAELDPFAMTTEEQFVVGLRRLRERSGLTFKEIERRTSAGSGLPLPSSTLATALHRNTVPRREIVEALVEVCDGDVARWLTARERLLHPMPAEPSAPPVQDENPPAPSSDAAPPDDAVPPDDAGPAEEPGRLRSRPRRGVAAVVAAAVAVAAIAAGIVLTHPSQGKGPSQAAPDASPARPSSGSTLLLGGFCLSERRNDRAGLVFLAHCAESFPPRQLTRDGEHWRVTTRHPQFGDGCMGVLDASFGPGSPMSDDTCDRTEPDLFTLRSSAGGVQLRPQGGDLCVGVKGEPAVRAPVLQLPCDERAPGQLFTVAER